MIWHETSSLAIVIPAFNEALTINDVVTKARALGHVIVVDDGSRDETARVAREAGAQVLSLAKNSGYEAALNAGFSLAFRDGHAFIMTMDADNQHNAESAKELFTALGDADIAIGIRRKKQRLMEVVGGWIGYLLWGISDPFSGLKIYRAETCQTLMPFDSQKLIGGEMFTRGLRSGLTVVGVPIVTADRVDFPRFGNTFRANTRLARATALLIAIYIGLLR